MTIPIARKRPLAGMLTAGAILASSHAMAEPVSLTVDYSCTYPLIGAQPLTAEISSDIPAEQPVGEPTGSFDISVLATARGDTRVGLELVGGTNIDGTATAQSNLSGNNLDLDLAVPVTIPNQDIEEGTGSFQLTASGSTPSLTFTETNQGEVMITVGNLDMNLIARNDAGEPVLFPNSDPDTGEFPVPCTLVAGQDNVLHTFDVIPDIQDPDIVVSPAALDFGNVQAGMNENLALTVSNQGSGSLGVNNVTISGLDAGDFMQSNNCTTVAPGDSCQVDVTFFASGEGPSSATLSIDSTDPDEPVVDVPLDGNSVIFNPADIEVSPTSVDFGEVQSGLNDTQTVTVSNSGGEALGINSVTLGGGDAGAFMQSNNCTTLTAGGSCQVDITFFASGDGSRNAVLSISSTDPDEATIDVPVSGTSIIDDPADIAVNPAQLDFGTVSVGDSANASVTVTNEGGDPLDITGINIAGSHAGDFMQTHDCSQLAADASCSIDVSFAPSAAGPRSASLEINSNDPDTPSLSVALTGEGDSGSGGSVDLDLDIDGETKLRLVRHPVPLTGTVESSVDLATGMVTADLTLDPTTAKLRLPFFRVSIDVEFEQTETTSGTFSAGQLNTTSRMHLVLKEIRARLFGFFEIPIGGGAQCRTIDPAVIELSSPADEPFDLSAGGPVEGTYTLPPVENCGGLEGLINPIMSGPDNTIRLNLTPET